MSSEGQERAAGDMVSAGRRLLGPRPGVIAAAAACVIGVVFVLAQLVSSSQGASRRTEQERFASGAVVRGQLTASLLSTSSASLRASAPKVAPSSQALNRLVRTSHLGYAAMLSSDGTVIATSSGAPATLSRRLAQRPDYVRQALSGRAWLSKLQPALPGRGAMLDWAVPFKASAGRRVLVEGIPAAALATFLSSFLEPGLCGAGGVRRSTRSAV